MLNHDRQFQQMSARNEQQCRERIKKSIKTLGDIYYNFDSVYAWEALICISLTIKEIGFKTIDKDDIWRWFYSRKEIKDEAEKKGAEEKTLG